MLSGGQFIRSQHLHKKGGNADFDNWELPSSRRPGWLTKVVVSLVKQLPDWELFFETDGLGEPVPIQDFTILYPAGERLWDQGTVVQMHRDLESSKPVFALVFTSLRHFHGDARTLDGVSGVTSEERDARKYHPRRDFTSGAGGSVLISVDERYPSVLTKSNKKKPGRGGRERRGQPFKCLDTRRIHRHFPRHNSLYCLLGSRLWHGVAAPWSGHARISDVWFLKMRQRFPASRRSSAASVAEYLTERWVRGGAGYTPARVSCPVPGCGVTFTDAKNVARHSRRKHPERTVIP
jgi:hypothetical protein